MRIDAYTHFIPEKYFKKIVESGHADIGKRVREIPCIHDLDVRRKIVDGFKDYAQILSYPMPPLEVMTKGDAKLTEEYTKLDERWLRRDLPEIPRSVSRLGRTSSADRARCRCARGRTRAQERRAWRADLHQHRRQAARRSGFRAVFRSHEQVGKPVWMHPARAANFPDYLTEKKSKYEIWWTFGWSYETAAAMARLVFSGIMDKYPNLKIITHHFGGIAPMLEGRIGPGWDQLGARTSDEDLSLVLKSLKKRPLDYFKHEFYADTAVFGGVPATHAGFAFYDLDKIVFASDCPFDPEKGTMYTRETLRIIEEINMPTADKEKVWHGNLERITGVKFKG